MDVKLGNLLVGGILLVFAALSVIIRVDVLLEVLGVFFLVYFLNLARQQKRVFTLEENKSGKEPAVALKAVEGLADSSKLKEALDWLESLPEEKSVEKVV